MIETDLFKPVRKLLLEKGYDVQGEILAADVFAVNEQKEIIIVELKLTISLKLIYQAIERQKVTPYVYIAAPQRVVKAHMKSHAAFHTLLKRLGIGLIEVYHDEAKIIIEPVKEPNTSVKIRSSQKSFMMREFNSRDQYQSLGGTKGKKMTAYREKVVEIAKALHTLKEAPLKLIKEYTRIDKTADILRDNYDQWFIKNEKGLYQLSPLGEEEIVKHLF